MGSDRCQWCNVNRFGKVLQQQVILYNWILTRVLWCRKRLLCQLCHCPQFNLFDIFIFRVTSSSFPVLEKTKNISLFPFIKMKQNNVKLEIGDQGGRWSSGYGRRLCSKRLWVQIPAPYLGLSFVAKFVMCVWKEENKWKRGRGLPILEIGDQMVHF